MSLEDDQKETDALMAYLRDKAARNEQMCDALIELVTYLAASAKPEWMVALGYAHGSMIRLQEIEDTMVALYGQAWLERFQKAAAGVFI
jgi:hypothetical protein